MSETGTRHRAFIRHGRSGETIALARTVPVERAVAVEINGFAHAVMMATPTDLHDFAVGFALGERLIDRADQIMAFDHHVGVAGDIVRVTLVGEGAATIAQRVRHRTTDTACGLCGVESLETAMRPLPRLPPAPPVAAASVFAALAALPAHQPLSAATGATHAAALCGHDGTVRLVREDVGRHNAFDKLVGAMARRGLRWDAGFALLTSRCSFELVEKAALSGCPTLATISAATDLALARAAECGLELIVLARPDALLHAG